MTGTTTRDVRLPGIGTALRVTGAPDLPDVLQAILPGWTPAVVEAEKSVPAIRLEATEGGFRQHAPALSRSLTHDTPVSAACSVVADLIERFLDRHPEFVGLHCASVAVNGRLLLFPASHRAGKSTLAAALAAVGQRVFGDDVLALDEAGEGMALGIAPRLRLPLPGVIAPALRDFATRHVAAEDARYRYLGLPSDRLADHGERLPLGGVILLERDDRLAAPELLPLAAGEGLTQLLRQHFAHDLPSDTLMARFLPLMRAVPCRLLRYNEPFAAARHLVDALDSDSSGEREAPARPRDRFPARTEPAAVQPDTRLRAATAVREYPLDDDRFLIHEPSGAIHRLNGTGQLVWGLLQAEVISGRELADLLGAHFATVPYKRIESDVFALLADLLDEGLVVPAG